MRERVVLVRLLGDRVKREGGRSKTPVVKSISFERLSFLSRRCELATLPELLVYKMWVPNYSSPNRSYSRSQAEEFSLRVSRTQAFSMLP